MLFRSRGPAWILHRCRGSWSRPQSLGRDPESHACLDDVGGHDQVRELTLPEVSACPLHCRIVQPGDIDEHLLDHHRNIELPRIRGRCGHGSVRKRVLDARRKVNVIQDELRRQIGEFLATSDAPAPIPTSA